MSEPTTALARQQDEQADRVLTQLRAYQQQADKYNVLTPIITLGEGEARADFLVTDIALVGIKPEDLYNDARFASDKAGKHALNAHGLGKIATAAGIRWVEQCEIEARERRPNGHVYVRTRSTGAVREINGEWRVISKHKEIDTEDELEFYIAEARRRAKRNNQKVDEDALLEAARDRMFQLRQHVLSHCETKGQSRVIRGILNLKQVYTTDELRRPFVVPRLLARPELTRSAIDTVWGPGASRALGPAEPRGDAGGPDASASVSTASPPPARNVPAEDEAGSPSPSSAGSPVEEVPQAHDAETAGSASSRNVGQDPRKTLENGEGSSGPEGPAPDTSEGGDAGAAALVDETLAPPDAPVAGRPSGGGPKGQRLPTDAGPEPATPPATSSSEPSQHEFEGTDRNGPCQVKDCGYAAEAHRAEQGRLA